MRNAMKVFLFGFLFSATTAVSASAQENTSWVQKVKGFFKRPAAGQTQSVDEVKRTKPEEKTETPASAKKISFDFSEKTIGDREAPLKINLITSLTCPHCTGVHTQLLPYLKEKYVDTKQALIILTDFPLDRRAMTATMVSRCLTGNAYFAFMETLFEKQHAWAVAPDIQEALFPYAKLAGLSEDDVRSCAADKAAEKEMIRQRNLSIMRYKVHATPTIILQLGKEKETFEGAPSRKDVDEAIEKLKAKYTGEWPSARTPTETAASAP